MGRITPEMFERAAAIAEKLFAAGQAHAAKQGLILADTKYEMGLDASGKLVVDRRDPHAGFVALLVRRRLRGAARRGEEPRSLDKEFVRRWLAGEAKWTGDGPPPVMPAEIRIEAARRYIASYELVTGTAFVPDTREPVARIAAALGADVLVLPGRAALSAAKRQSALYAGAHGMPGRRPRSTRAGSTSSRARAS